MALSLKEAYRYQNVLSERLDRALIFLNKEGFMTNVEYEHQRSAANPSAKNTTELGEKEEIADGCTPNILLDYIMEVVDEKRRLTLAIDAAKQKAEFRIDAELMDNRTRQALVAALKKTDSFKSKEVSLRATDYCFNNEGNQVSYCYDKKAITTIDFDRNRVKRLKRILTAECDETSKKADMAMLTIQVEIEPRFDLSDTFTESVENYLKDKN